MRPPEFKPDLRHCFSGPDTAVDLVFAFLCVRAITFWTIWHASGLA